MRRIDLSRDGVTLSGFDTDAGPAVLFQHGLGADKSQVAEIFPGDLPLRRLTLECRGHGSSDAGFPPSFSIATFADDALAFVDRAGAGSFMAGGISMGAAIALRLTVLCPQRVKALILIRPAWLCEAAPDNMRPFIEVAEHLLSDQSPESALARFRASPTARQLAETAPDNLASLESFFLRPDRRSIARLLSAIATNGPGIGAANLEALRVPAIVVGNAGDHIHPLEMARTLAGRIPGAEFVEVTAKSIDRPRHIADVRSVIRAFLRTHGVKDVAAPETSRDR